jgi:cyclophilin family peptidyl-prolyl cis-trans isomerase
LVLAIVGLIFFLRSQAKPMTENQNQNQASPSAQNATPSASVSGNPTATIELQKGGIIRIQLMPNFAPKTVANFTAKANSGSYDNLTFHRVVPGFVVQGGDPAGNGTGGGNQPTELSSQPFKRGAVGIARGADINVSNDMQFFIVTADADSLDNQYTNFGQVIEGMDVVDKIQIGDKIRRIRVQ